MSMVLSERHGSVAILTLNNPGQYNAITEELLADLRAALDAALAADGVRAILLTGAGKGFCSGAQLGGAMFGRMMGDGDGVTSLLTRSFNPPQPIKKVLEIQYIASQWQWLVPSVVPRARETNGPLDTVRFDI